MTKATFAILNYKLKIMMTIPVILAQDNTWMNVLKIELKKIKLLLMNLLRKDFSCDALHKLMIGS